MAEEIDAERPARPHAEPAQRRTNFGTLLLLVALVIVVLQASGSGTKDWPYVLAVVLAVVGAGLRIEGAILRRTR